MSADIFGLKHKNIESRCMKGVTPERPTLICKDILKTKSWRSSEITASETSLGSFVSVPLMRADDGRWPASSYLSSIAGLDQPRNSRPSAFSKLRPRCGRKRRRKNSNEAVGTSIHSTG
jgi:hypothetical protein